MIHKYLAYLKTIETGSITQAAAELGYTQSAVSRMIADLEEHWDVPLLTRNRSGIEISSEGTQLLPILQSIVKGQEELSFAVGELHGLQSGLIRVGAFTSMATGWMPLMIKTFHEKYPNIRFQIFNGEYNQIATWLRRGQIDCGFLALPCAKEFDTTFLLRDSLTVILPPNHPLRDAECFPVSRLSDEDFISLMEEQDYEINLFLEHLRQSPRIKFEVSSDFAILAMVECGLGISVVHDLILHPNRHGIIKKPLDEPYYRDIAIATSAAAQPSTITRMFCEHALEWARDTSSAIAPATAEAPASIIWAASSPLDTPPIPRMGRSTAWATSQTIRTATGRTAGPDRPPVFIFSTGRRVFTSMRIPRRVLMSERASAPAPATARAISVMSVTLGESFTITGTEPA